MTQREMIDDCAWLGPFVAFHSIGPYAFVEHHPHIRDGSTVTRKADMTKTEYSAFVDGKNTHSGYETLESALAGAIAYKMEGHNHKADRYFILALEAIASK